MSNKQNKRDRMRRIVALIMVLFLLISVFGSVIFYLVTPVFADDTVSIADAPTTDADPDSDDEQTTSSEDTNNTDTDSEDNTEDTEDTANTEDTEDTDSTESSESTDNDEEPTPLPDIEIPTLPEAEVVDDKLIRVALMYGSGVTVGFEVDTDYGFYINKVNRTGDLTSEPIWELDITKVSCTVDHNLSKSAMTYSKTSNSASTVIGGYHVEIGSELSREDAFIIIYAFGDVFAANGVYAIPSYINGAYAIRAGHFATEAAASALANKLASAFGDIPVKVVKPTNTAVSLVDPLTDKILFEYDCGDVTALGLTPKNSPDGKEAYLVTPAKKLYDGTFMFRRYISGSVDGVSLTDIIPLEEYIEGVVPYEINASWHEEALKAFAIMVRSYVLAKVRHESSYQTDICNSTHCQVYGGRTKVNAAVEKAVADTKGLVMSYNGKIAEAFYSAVTGGVTLSSYDAWGYTHIPYLVAVETPWENYNNHSYGVWTAEVSPSALCSHLNSKGYTSLKGSIKSITIDKYAENSTYVRDITFTDIYGTKVSIKASANVYTLLSKYVKSANFVVGKGQVETDETEFYTVALDSLKARTANGTYALDAKTPVSVRGAEITSEAGLDKATVLTASGEFTLGGTTSVSKTVTIHAKNSDNFIFAGKGWGHGVGASQIGLRDLANIGYKAAEILPKYYTGVDVEDWREINK